MNHFPSISFPDEFVFPVPQFLPPIEDEYDSPDFNPSRMWKAKEAVDEAIDAFADSLSEQGFKVDEDFLTSISIRIFNYSREYIESQEPVFKSKEQKAVSDGLKRMNESIRRQSRKG